MLKNLIDSPSYLKKVICHLKPEYFSERIEKEIFKSIEEYHTRYHNAPTLEVLSAELEKKVNLSQEEFERGNLIISEFAREVKAPDLEWLVNETEQFCLSQSVANAISSAIEIMGGEGKQPITAIPDLMREALNISFDSNVGHDYAADYASRHAKLREQTERMEFDLHWLNKVFGGGLMRKTLNFFLGGPGSGKSLALVHTGAQFYKMGYNVLYVSLELAEERIGERIDANLFDMEVADVYDLGIDQYKKRINILTSMNKGARFFIREYPPASITTSHLRSLLDELETKKGFKPDILIVDYINLMNSSRYKASSGANSYTILKSVAEELRGLACEKNIACWTATQSNRGGVGASDLDMTNVADSMGLIMTADTMIAIIRSEELDELGQCIFKCLKTRFSDLTNHRSIIGIEEAKMKLTNIDSPGFVAQTSQKHNPQATHATSEMDSKFGGVNPPRRNERAGTGGIQV